MHLPLSVSIAAVLCALGLAAHQNLSAASFLEDFSTDTSGNYTGTRTSFGGSPNPFFDVTGGTLNIDPDGNNSYTVFHNTAVFDVGDTLSVGTTTSSAADIRLSVSTAAVGPNSGSNNGVRLKRNRGDGSFVFQAYAGGDTNFHPSFNISAGTALTLFLTRETANTFSAAYDAGSGLVQLNTSGGSEKQIFTVTGLTSASLFVGVESYASTTSFDNLRVVLTSSQPIISSFSASATEMSEPGEVTFTWSIANGETVTLNGVDVSGQSPLTLSVNQSSDFTLLVENESGASITRTIRVFVGESFSIAAVSDPQYADVPVGWRGSGREPEEGVNRLSHAVSQYNQRDLDWGVVLGDLIDFDDVDYPTSGPPPGEVYGPHDWANTDAILAAWNQLNIPKYLLLGNHEFYVPNADVDGMKKPYSVFRKFGFDQQPYYSFRHKGFRFIVLMADWRYLDFDPSLPEYTVARNYYDNFSGTQKRWYNGAISLKQRRWLMERLDESLALGEPVVCMAHDPIHNPTDGHSLMNKDEMLNILNGYPNVVMWMNGHNHGGGYALEGRRHHLNLKGMQNEADNWYQLDFNPAQITLYKAENTATPERTMDILRPAPTISAPTGFAVTEVSGEASLSWDEEPAAATHVVIERRHVSTLIAEIPSTAQTLSWQTVATLPVPTSQSYLDAPTGPVGEYKYRIHFLGGAEGSYHSPASASNELAKMSYVDYATSLGADGELANEDTDSDGNSNALELFYGTNLLTADREVSRELSVSRTPAGATRLVFSYDTSALMNWDIALSKDLSTWKIISENVDYRIVLTEAWTPPGTSKNLIRVTLELMDTTSFNFSSDDSQIFVRLLLTS